MKTLLFLNIIYFFPIILLASPGAYAEQTSGNLELHFIDAGQGDSTLVVCPNGKSILVDTGSLTVPTASYIRNHILDRIGRREPGIDSLVITHPHPDHYNLIAEALRGVSVDQLFLGGELPDYSRSFREWIGKFPNRKITLFKPDYFDKEGLENKAFDCGGARVYVLAASLESEKAPINSKSVVLMIRYGDFEAILAADATYYSEKVIMSRYCRAWLNADLLKVGHHGAPASSTSPQWAAVVRPETAVISAGRKNRFGRPGEKILMLLEPYTKSWKPHPMISAAGEPENFRWIHVSDYKEAIFSTAASGTVIVTSSGSGYRVRTSLSMD